MAANPRHVAALVDLLSACPELANGWAGAAIAEQVCDRRHVESRHTKRFAGFQRRLKRKFSLLFPEVEQSIIYNQIEVWEWWACAFRFPVDDTWWHDKLSVAQRVAIMDDSAYLVRDKVIRRYALAKLIQSTGDFIFQKTVNPS